MAGEWSPAHDLVNMYLGIGHLADDELDPEERRTFLLKFRQWMPEVDSESFAEVWNQVMSLYRSMGTREQRYSMYLQSVVNIAQFMGDDKNKLRAIIRDLVDIAGADGVLHDNEVTLIKAAAISYGFSADMRVNAKTGQVELDLKEAN